MLLWNGTQRLPPSTVTKSPWSVPRKRREGFFRSSANRERYAEALVDGIVMYCEEIEIPRLGWKMHTVSSGESLSKIAHAYAMDVDTLRSANALAGDRIYVGQRLRVRPR